MIPSNQTSKSTHKLVFKAQIWKMNHVSNFPHKLKLILLLLLGFSCHVMPQNALREYNHWLAPKVKHGSENYDSFLNKYDVSFYKIDLSMERFNINLSGNTTILAKVTSAVLDTFCFELSSIISIDSVLFNQNAFVFTRNDDFVMIALDLQPKSGDLISVQVFYHGTPPSSDGFWGIKNAYTYDTQITWTLSEPFAAKYWFPCKQVLEDKADSAYIFITTDSTSKVASNGLLCNVKKLSNNKVKYEWKTHIPIAYYLICVSVCNYQEYNFYVKPENYHDSIFVQNFILKTPNYLLNNKETIDRLHDYLNLFSNLYGLYPFNKEKYGTCITAQTGGMEHQTMTSLQNHNFALSVHELSHQWFGDNVTCGTWNDIWLNEGFATYSEYLSYQYLNNPPVTIDVWLAEKQRTVLTETDGSVYIPITEKLTEDRIFNGRLSYTKGGLILHQLRAEINDDSIFFAIFRAYQEKFGGRTAISNDFINIVDSLTGKNFAFFFNQWLYGEGYPEFTIIWNQQNDSLFIKSWQNGSSPTTSLFEMSLDFTIHYIDGDTTLRLQQSENYNSFAIPVNRIVSSIELDKENFFMKKIISIKKINQANNNSEGFLIFPNPAESEVSLYFFNPITENVSLKIRDINGRLISISGITKNFQYIDISYLKKGIYFFTIIKNGLTSTQKVIKTL